MPDLLTETNKNKIRKRYVATEALVIDEWPSSEDTLNENISFQLDLMNDRSDYNPHCSVPCIHVRGGKTNSNGGNRSFRYRLSCLHFCDR